MFTLKGAKVPNPRRVFLIVDENSDDEPVVVFTNQQHIQQYALGDGKTFTVKKHKSNKYILWPTPSCIPDQRDCVLVAGQSGSGKTTWVRNYTSTYAGIYPNRDILYFSTKQRDKVLDQCKWIKRVPREEWNTYIGEKQDKQIKKQKMDEEYEEQDTKMIPLHDISKTLFIFDDVDEDDRANDIQKFKMYLIKLGRSEGIDVVSTSHLVSNFNKTREELNETTTIVLFPWTGVHNHMTRYMSTYLGLTEAQIKKITNRAIKCATLHLRHPVTVVTEDSAWIV